MLRAWMPVTVIGEARVFQAMEAYMEATNRIDTLGTDTLGTGTGATARGASA